MGHDRKMASIARRSRPRLRRSERDRKASGFERRSRAVGHCLMPGAGRSTSLLSRGLALAVESDQLRMVRGEDDIAGGTERLRELALSFIQLRHRVWAGTWIDLPAAQAVVGNVDAMQHIGDVVMHHQR